MVYLDIAEEQTLNQKPMYMKDRQKKIDDYLCMTRRDALETAEATAARDEPVVASAEEERER